MNRGELVEKLNWDEYPPLVAELSLEAIHSHVLNESPILFKRWYAANEIIIITPNAEDITTEFTQTLSLLRWIFYRKPIAIGKIMRHVDITTDGVLHRYSEVEILAFYPEDSQVPLDQIDYTVVEDKDDEMSPSMARSYLQKILTFLTGKT